MRTKILLLFILVSLSSYLRAQDTVRSLIISEARLDAAHEAYVELTNMGDSTLHLKNFEFGVVHPWNTRIDQSDINKWFTIEAHSWFMLPDWTLAPGKSIVIANIYDYNPKMWRMDPEHWSQAITKPEMWKLADIQINQPESPVQPMVGDSVSTYYDIGRVWKGRDCWYVRYHFSYSTSDSIPMIVKDSIVIDQVGGVFNGTNGQQSWEAKDVAGVADATKSSILVRKFTVKQGNIDFNIGRGTSAAESEWITVPVFNPNGGWEPDRAVLWTVGNHVDAHLDAQTLVSSTVNVNFTDSTMLVPWGTRRDDSIMYLFERRPGLAWHYDYATSHEDSAYISVRTGDVLTLYACGNVGTVIRFTLVVAPPAADLNKVIPKKVPNAHLTYTNTVPFCEVTDKVAGMDTIRENVLYGIPFGTRVDTLFKYLEKAPAASWRILFIDGTIRTDLKNGDILEVTAEDETSVKDYYIKVAGYKPGHNANLAFITWPDIPECYRGTYGWAGDTIAGFLPSKFNYTVTVPFDVAGIPALLAKNADINAKLDVKIATTLDGSVADRTVTFTSTAEDNLKVQVYNVVLEKGKEIANVQPYIGEPFISQYCFKQDYANDYLEIVNPGNQPLDLSHYMLTFSEASDPAQAIINFTSNSGADWTNRYNKYIPGMKWQDESNWGINPAIAISDIATNPMLLPGDVFVIADVRSRNNGTAADYLLSQIDIDFANNKWGETVAQANAMDQKWAISRKTILFKILNDSVYNGIKAATDPADFKVIDMLGYDNAGNTTWVIGGKAANQVTNWTRKPSIYKGNPNISTGDYPGGSFGTDWNNSEWTYDDESSLQALGYGWPNWRVQVADGIGSHYMLPVAVYKSTVTSPYYKVSPGYTLAETIIGVPYGTTVNEFLGNIFKEDTGEHLSLLRGAILAGPDVLADQDTLFVISQDSSNTTRYILTVGAPLSNDAVLTSVTITVNVTGLTGTVSGFNYGELLRSVLDSLIAPAGASLIIVDNKGAYVPLKYLNFDTVYVDTRVSDQIFLIVIAEDGKTRITYHLQPNAGSSDAFVTSDVYLVYQQTAFIDLIPAGTTVYGLLRFLTPAPGATMKVVDKFGYERTEGFIYRDDILIVTAQDGIHTKTYYLQRYCPCPPPYLAYVISDVYTIDQVNLTIEGAGITNGMMVIDFIANLIPAPHATIKVVDSMGVENTGVLLPGDQVEVTAGDGHTKANYTISLCCNPPAEAYVLSNVYLVDQDKLTIDGGLTITNSMNVSDLIANLIPALGATIKVINAVGVENTGILNLGDRVEVTASDGIKMNYYTLFIIDAVYELRNGAFSVYPNPSSGNITLEGVTPGHKFVVSNILGQKLFEGIVLQDKVQLSLEGQPVGIYFLQISSDSKVLACFKLIVK